MQETPVWFLVRKIPWRGHGNPCQCFAPETEQPGGLQSLGGKESEATEVTEHTGLHTEGMQME